MSHSNLIIAGSVGFLGIGTAAQASALAYHKQGINGWGDQCLGVGYYGKQQGQWTNWYCVTVVPSGETGRAATNSGYQPRSR